MVPAPTSTTSASRRVSANTFLSAGEEMEPLRPSSPVDAPSKVRPIIARTQRRPVGHGYAAARSAADIGQVRGPRSMSIYRSFNAASSPPTHACPQSRVILRRELRLYPATLGPKRGVEAHGPLPPVHAVGS